MFKGRFIVFEGIDGSGTTTQCRLLVRYLEDLSLPVVFTREPGGTVLGEKLRSLVLDSTEEIDPAAEMLLYAASRAQHVAEIILPALNAGKVVVCDRFIVSSLAYQGYGRGLGVEAVWQANRLALVDCRPDLTIYLDLPVSVASLRRQQRAGNPDRIELLGDSFQARVAQAYRELACKDPGQSLLLDGTENREIIAAAIKNKLRERWPHFSCGTG